MKFQKYDKRDKISYAIGQFATIELIKSGRAKVLAFLFSDKIKIDESVEYILDYAKKNGVEIIYNTKQIESISGKENVYCIGVFEKYDGKINSSVNNVVLVEPSDMGNMGTIIRTMLGFNFTDLAIINDRSSGVDVFNPKVIRASMGAIFKLNIEYFKDFESYNNICKNKLVAFCLNAKTYLQDINSKEISALLNSGKSQNDKNSQNFSLVFGNEASGLPDKIIEKCYPLKIRQSSKIDSFNLAVSVALALYKFTE